MPRKGRRGTWNSLFTSINLIFPSSNPPQKIQSFPVLLCLETCLAVITIILATADIEILLPKINKRSYNNQYSLHLSLRIPIYFLNILLVCLVYFRLYSKLPMQLSLCKSVKSDIRNFYRLQVIRKHLGLIKRNMFELSICTSCFLPVNIFIPVGNTEYELSMLLYPFVLLRLCLCLNLVQHLVGLDSTEVGLICTRYQAKMGKGFLLRYLLREYPMTCLVILGAGSAVIFGYLVRVYELPYYIITKGMHEEDQDYQDFTCIWNGFWLIVISMTTVGYGDFYAVTVMGRLVSVASIISGIFVISLSLEIKCKLFTRHEETCLELL